MLAHHLPLRPSSLHRQRGAALLIIVVLMVIGAIAMFVAALNSSNPQISRNKVTADALAKAKAALIGYAASDANHPGELPCPDVDGDGQLTMTVDYSGSSCASPIGRLPWKTLGIPELRDGAGEDLWYAVAKNFWAMGTPVINSDTQGDLTVKDVTSGSTIASQLVAIVFAPGSPLAGQDRSSTAANCTTTNNASLAANLCASNYLEDTNPAATFNVFTATGTAINTGYKTGAASSSFNDQAIFITHDQLLAPVEMRIAREAKQCLDNYEMDSNNSNHRYPWAARDDDSSYTGKNDTLFGRIPTHPLTMTNNVTLDTTYALPMLSALGNLQTALNNYSASINATTTAALLSAGQTLITAATNASSSGSFSSYSSITGNADNAGDNGRDLANGVSGVYISTVQNYLNNTYYYLDNYNFIDKSMPNYWDWPSSCVFSNTGTYAYWNNWQQEVFYQFASADRPGSGLSVCNTSCLVITGSGNPNSGSGTYSAAVIVGRAHVASLDSAVPVYSDPASYSPYKSYYLEGSNKHSSYQDYFSSPQLSQTFVTYRPTDSNYSSINDLILCLDGRNNCK
jgi:hypothetical protein